MKTIIEGFRKFRSVTYAHERALFEQLAGGQQPLALVISCADSRVSLQGVTHSRPGQLFFQRNAGNIVPLWGDAADGVAATVEYAMAVLKIPDLVICGHSDCGAMKALAGPARPDDLRAVALWLEHARDAHGKAFGSEPYTRTEPATRQQCEHLERTNVLVQLQHVTTHPSVAERLAAGQLRLHGWYYDIGRGCIDAYDAETEEWRPLEDDPLPHATPAARAVALAEQRA